MILSGPHFFVGNPLYKTPRRQCTQNGHYEVLDLVALPADYTPRTNYVPACEATEYSRRTPSVPWPHAVENAPCKSTAYHRVLNRCMVGPAAERTLITALSPKHVAQIDTAVACAFREVDKCIEFAALSFSLLLDFFIKSTGATHVRRSWLSRSPHPH